MLLKAINLFAGIVGDEDFMEIDGLMLINDFINKEEEDYLMERIDRVEWALSQSGRRKQVCQSIRIMPIHALRSSRIIVIVGLWSSGQFQAQESENHEVPR